MNENSDSISVIVYDQISFNDSESLYSNSFISKFLSTGSVSASVDDEGADKISGSIIVKSMCQDYTGILAGLDAEQSELQEKHSNSIAVTTAKGSLVEGKKKEEFSLEIVNNNTFAVPNRFHCKNCDQVILSVIKYAPSHIGFWKKVKKMISNSRCCAQRMENMDIIHECPLCQSVLIRITEL